MTHFKIVLIFYSNSVCYDLFHIRDLSHQYIYIYTYNYADGNECSVVGHEVSFIYQNLRRDYS